MIDSKPVPGFEGLYSVSRDGQVYNDKTGRVLAHQPKDGYSRVLFRKGGKRKSMYVGHVVLLAFVGPRPAKHKCQHLDGDVNNNRLSNLAWVPRDTRKHGAGVRKLTDGQVLELRLRRAAGEKIRVLAEEFGMSQTAIHSCCTGRTHQYLPFAVKVRKKLPLTEERILSVRRLAVDGRSVRDIAKETGVSKSSVAVIVREMKREERA